MGTTLRVPLEEVVRVPLTVLVRLAVVLYDAETERVRAVPVAVGVTQLANAGALHSPGCSAPPTQQPQQGDAEAGHSAQSKADAGPMTSRMSTIVACMLMRLDARLRFWRWGVRMRSTGRGWVTPAGRSESDSHPIPTDSRLNPSPLPPPSSKPRCRRD